MKLPPLKALAYFNAAASQASFKAAASQLSVTEGAVSRQIKRLEAYFGHALFERAGRGVRLTSRGRKIIFCKRKRAVITIRALVDYAIGAINKYQISL